MDAAVKTAAKGKGTTRPVPVIKKVGVIGAGQMGTGIAHVIALAGYDVALNDIVKKGYVLQDDAPGMRAVAADWAKKLDRK